MRRTVKKCIALTLALFFVLSNVAFAGYLEEERYLGEIPKINMYEPGTPSRDKQELIMHEEINSEILNPNEKSIGDIQFSIVSALNSKLSGIIQDEGRSTADCATVTFQPNTLVVLPYDSMGVPLYEAEMELVVNGVHSVHQTQTGVFYVEGLPDGSNVRFQIKSERESFIPREIPDFNYEIDGLQLRYAFDGVQRDDIPVETRDFHIANSTSGNSNLTSSSLIAVGNGNFTIASRHDNTVWAWGDNSGGQLGNGTTISSRVPVQVQNIGGLYESQK